MRYLSRIACAAFAALAVLATASAGVNTPQSAWYSGNPLLGPNALRDLDCAGLTCYAAGDFGTLLRSDDGGATWKGIITGLTLDLRRVGLVGGSPDKVVIGSDCALRRSDSGGDNFIRLPFTARDQGCTAQLVAFSFPTNDVGYVLLAGSRFLATADGGRSFSRRTNVPQVAGDLLCTRASTCFTAGPGGIMRTDDGGVSWSPAASTTYPMRRFAAADPFTLYAGGEFDYLAKSTDGGRTWSSFRMRGGTTNNTVDIACGDALHCLMATRNGTLDGPLYRTSDGGVNVSLVTPSSDPAYAVAFAGPLRGLAAGAVGSAEVSTDAGATWTAVGTRIAGEFAALAATAPKVAYAGGKQGTVVRTADAGQTWSTVNPPTEATVTSLTGFGPDRLYVLAADGSLQRSDNGGTSYSLLNPGTARPTALFAIDPDRLLLLGRGLSLSTDGGETFAPASGKVARAQLSAADAASGAVFAYGQRAIFVSTDSGNRWRPVGKPKGRGIVDVDFVSRNVGYVLDARGVLSKTTNGGHGWAQLRAVGTTALAVEFSNRLEGFVMVRGVGSVLNRGVVLRTSDGGHTWHPQVVSPLPMAALENGGAVDYALAGAGALYATDVGGDAGSARSLTISARPHVLRRPGRVLVRGRLTPAVGGEEIVVSALQRGRWTHRLATASANGTFETRWQLRRGAVFVAQVLGDADRRGAGTTPLLVRVR